jgi:hypothetical protein
MDRSQHHAEIWVAEENLRRFTERMKHAEDEGERVRIQAMADAERARLTQLRANMETPSGRAPGSGVSGDSTRAPKY